MASTVLSIPAKEDLGKRESTELRRREILDSALACFLRSGVQGTTMKQIQSESGASSGSIYHLFRGKDEIAMTLFLEGMDVYNYVLEEAM